MLGRPLIATVKVNHKRVYRCILTKIPLPWKRGWLKTRLKNGFCLFQRNPVARFFFHRLHTTNSHKTPSLNSVLEKKVLTETVFIIRRKSFSPLAQYHHQKFHPLFLFCNISLRWFLKYILGKFLEILTTGSFEICKFLQKHPVSIF